VLHVRCPANLSGLALSVLRARRDRRPLWVKYAGNWRPDGPEPWSYRTQRAWLRKGWGTVAVTVNGAGDDPPHVRAFDNPSLSEEDLIRGAAATKAEPIRLAFVGRLVADKGPVTAVEIAARLGGLPLDVVGDGPERTAVEQRADELGVDVNVHGWLDTDGVRRVLAQDHVLLLPSRTEGWPKVLSEAMAYGVVPVAPPLPGVVPVFEETGAGVLATDRTADAFVAALAPVLQDLTERRRAGIAAAGRFTFAAYLDAVRQLFADRWGIEL
jgi:glycosyltransferase involved in cell wall biosynthesis